MKKLSCSLIMIILFSMSIGMINLDAEDLEEKKIEQMLPKYLTSNNAGTKFFLTFHPCWEESGANNAMKVYVSSGKATTVTAAIPAFGYSETQVTSPNGIIEFSIDPSIASMYRRTFSDKPEPEKIWQGRAIIIESDDPVVVYGVARFRYTGDGYLAIPVTGYDKSYQVSAFTDSEGKPYGDDIYYNSYTSIVVAYDNTDVSVTFGGTLETWIPSRDPESYEIVDGETGFRIGDEVTRTMNEGDVWLIPSRGNYGDLSGTLINSSKPIAVISGHFCAFIPFAEPACDYIIEQELPKSIWGKTYHVTPIVRRKYGSWIKIYAAEDSTTIYRDGEAIATIDKVGYEESIGFLSRRVLDQYTPVRPVTISADKPISITQYNTAQADDDVYSDPFQMVLVPLSRYQKEIYFTTPGIKGGARMHDNNVNLIYEADTDGSIPDDLEMGIYDIQSQEWNWQKINQDEFQENIIENKKFEDNNLNDNLKNYYNMIIELPDPTNSYRLRADKPIMGYFYAYDMYDGFGYPLSLGLLDLNHPNDTLAPRVDYTIDYKGNIAGTITDEPENDEDVRSNLRNIDLDSRSFNYNWSEDGKPEFIIGEDYQVDFALDIIDPTKDAKAVLYVMDKAGNSHIQTIEYTIPHLSIIKSREDWGLVSPDSEAITKTFTLVNNRDKSIEFDEIEVNLKSVFDDDEGDYIKHQGFTIVNLPEITSPIQPYQEFTFDVVFDPSEVEEGTFKDSIGVRLVRDGHTSYYKFLAYVNAKVGESVISVTDIDFPDMDISHISHSETFEITNNGNYELVITDYTGPNLKRIIDNNKIFTEDEELLEISEENPLTLSPGESQTFSISFNPDEAKDYSDEIVFESNSSQMNENHDPICVLTGKGTTNSFTVHNYSWLYKRTNLDKYDTYPYRDNVMYPAENDAILIKNSTNKSIVFNSHEILINDKGNSFKINDNEQYYSLTDDDILKELLYGLSLAPEAEYQLPVYFDPVEEGQHRAVINLITETGEVAQIDLNGTSIYPKINVNDINFTPSEAYSNHEEPLLDTLIVKCEDWGPYADYVTIEDIQALEPSAISFNSENYGTQGFMINKSELSFPIIVVQGDELEIPVYFSSQFTGKYEAELEIISDAEGTTTAKLEGEFFTSVSIAEKDEEINLTPQPASEFVTVEYEKGITSYKILDISGKLALEMKDLPKSNSIRIDLSELSAGVYFIEVNQDPKLRRKMIIE